MRPFSSYISLVKNEAVTARYNLAGTTPPVPENIFRKIPIDTGESPKARSYDRLLSRVERHLEARRGEVALSPGGCSQALTMTLAAMTDPGDLVLIETPTYEPFLSTARFLGLNVRRFERTGDFERDLRHASRHASRVKVILIANPGCPTGHLYSAEELCQLAELGPSLIVDEIYLPLFDKGSLTRVCHPRAIHISGLSKSTGLSGARVGWVRAHRATIEKVRQISTVFNPDMPMPSVQLAEAAFAHWPEILKPSLAKIRKNLRIVRDLPALEPPRGSFFSLKAPAKFKSGDEFARALLKKSIWVRAGELFDCPRTVRISLLNDPGEFVSVCALLRKHYA